MYKSVKSIKNQGNIKFENRSERIYLARQIEALLLLDHFYRAYYKYMAIHFLEELIRSTDKLEKSDK